jgi:hypothetical protein
MQRNFVVLLDVGSGGKILVKPLTKRGELALKMFDAWADDERAEWPHTFDGVVTELFDLLEARPDA